MKQNLLQYYVSLLRTNKDTQVSSEHKEQCATALHNVIRTMIFSRDSKICSEDFSNLDFGNIPLNGIKFSVDGYVPSSFRGSTLHEWNLYSGHRYPVTSAHFSGNGKYIITSDEEGKVIVWNVERKLIQSQYSIETDRKTSNDLFFYSPYSAVISQDGNFFATSCKSYHMNYEFGPYFFKYVNRESIKIWETSTGKHYCIPEYYCNLNFKFPVMEFSHDERYLITEYRDNKASIWDTSNGKFVRDLIDHQKEVTAVGFSEDDTLCITGSEDHTAKIWDTKTGKCIRTLEENGHQKTITAVAISNDKHYYLTGAEDGTVKLWTRDGKCQYTFHQHNVMVAKVRFDPNVKQCVTISKDGTITAWSFETGELIYTKSWHDRTMQFILAKYSDIFSGNYIYLYGEGFMIKELKSDLVISDFRYHYFYMTSLSISDHYFLVGCSNHHVILFYKNQKRKICDFCLDKKMTGFPTTVDISFDEHYCMFFSEINSTVFIYDMNTKKEVCVINEYKDIIHTSFVPEHNWLFVATYDGMVRYLDIATRECVCLFERDKCEIPLSIDFSQNGQYCFCQYADGAFVLWKFGNKKNIHIFEFEDVDHSFISVSNKYCALITKELNIWDIQAEELLNNDYLVGSLDKIKMFYFLGNGDYFVIGEDDSYDQKVYIKVNMFETETGSFIKDFETYEKPLLGFIKWKFPYYFCFHDNYVDVYQLDCFSSEDEILSNHIGRFYLVDDLNVKGCDFSNIDANDVIKDIISQYGGDL